MNSTTLCPLLFTLCLLFISHSPLPANARGHGHHSLARQICMQTSQDKTNCMKLLRKGGPKIMHAKNFVELTKAVLDLASNKGIEGQKFLRGLAQTNNAPAIVECANIHYDKMARSFKGMQNEFENDPKTASYDVKIVGDAAYVCENALADAHIVNPVISTFNREMKLLSHIAFLATSEVGRGDGDNSLFHQICVQTSQDKTNCMKILREADPKLMHAKNFVELTKAVLDLASNKGIEGQKFLRTLAQTNNAPAIVECANIHYDKMARSFKGMQNEFENDPKTASYDIKIVGDAAYVCENALADAHIVNPVISAFNSEMKLLSHIAFLTISEVTV